MRMPPAACQIVLCAAILLAGCTHLASPGSIAQRAAYALAAVSATRNTCADLVERDRMPPADGQTCLALTDEAGMLAGAAARAPAAEGAAGALERTYTLLRQAEDMIRTRENAQ